MVRGVTFKIPNERGFHLQHILAPVNTETYYWRSGGEEAYLVENGELAKPLFEGDIPFTGQALREKIKHQHYLIFVNLKAFTTIEAVQEIETYEEFLNSDCQFILLIIDSSYSAIFAKDKQLVHQLFRHVSNLNYQDVELITDQNDSFERLTVF